MVMAIVIVRGKWVCSFIVSSYYDVAGGDGDHNDEEKPTNTSYSGFFFLSARYWRFRTIEFFQGHDVSVTPDPQPGGPVYLCVRHLAQILFVVVGPTSR
jgi:hypothetical protein